MSINAIMQNQKDSTKLDKDTGIAAAALKLSEPRNIALTGAVTGSGTFDGSGDLSINTTYRSCVVGSNGATTNLWHKFADYTLHMAFGDTRATFLITNTRLLYRKKFGIVKLWIRNEKEPVITNKSTQIEFQWIYAGLDIKLENLILAYSNTNPTVVELWIKSEGGNDTYQITILDEGYLFNSTKPQYIWNLYNSVSNTGFEAPTEGYTQVPSTLSNLQTGSLNVHSQLYLNDNDGGKGLTTYNVNFRMDSKNSAYIQGLNNLENKTPRLYIRSIKDGGSPQRCVLSSVATPENYWDATPKDYVDAQDAKKLNKTGGTITGRLLCKVTDNFSSFLITHEVDTSKVTGDALKQLVFVPRYQENKKYPELEIIAYNGGNDAQMANLQINHPTQTYHAATKKYVDDQINALRTELASALNISLPVPTSDLQEEISVPMSAPILEEEEETY